jgi:hypothetical protein
MCVAIALEKFFPAPPARSIRKNAMIKKSLTVLETGNKIANVRLRCMVPHQNGLILRRAK